MNGHQASFDSQYDTKSFTRVSAGQTAARYRETDDSAGALEDGDEDYQHPFFELPPLERLQRKPKRDTPPQSQGIEFWKVLLALLICMLFAMGAYMVGQVYGATLIPEDEPVFIVPPTAEVPAVVPEPEPDVPPILTILLMGTDQRSKNELARADTIMLVTMNLDTKSVNMISIPRDTRAVIADTDKTTKINHAHALGGADQMVRTVENLLGVNVHYYVETNFQGFARCIDILGGVHYNVERRMVLLDEGIDLYPGQQKLSGDQALQYVRWREPATADIGRVGRQQQFLRTLLDQSMSVTTVPKLPQLIETLREYLITDMTAAQMVNLATRFADIQNLRFDACTLPGEAKYIGGVSYWVMDEAAARDLITAIYAPPVPETDDSGTAAEPEGGDATTSGL